MSIISIRGLCFSIVEYLMTKKEYQSAKTKMSLKEWFTLSRFRTEIPTYHIVVYYGTIAAHLFLLAFITIRNILGYVKGLAQIAIWALILISIFDFLYVAYFEGGVYTTWTRIYRPEKIKLRGIDKKRYLKRKNAENNSKKN